MGPSPLAGGCRDFALRLRGARGASAGVAGPGRGTGRRVRTDDVVKDVALPEFRLDVSSLLALLQVGGQSGGEITALEGGRRSCVGVVEV